MYVYIYIHIYTYRACRRATLSNIWNICIVHIVMILYTISEYLLIVSWAMHSWACRHTHTHTHTHTHIHTHTQKHVLNALDTLWVTSQVMALMSRLVTIWLRHGKHVISHICMDHGKQPLFWESRIYLYIYSCIYIYICVYVDVCVCVHCRCVCVCKYIYIYICIYSLWVASHIWMSHGAHVTSSHIEGWVKATCHDTPR